jgi:hypothetical protein
MSSEETHCFEAELLYMYDIYDVKGVCHFEINYDEVLKKIFSKVDPQKFVKAALLSILEAEEKEYPVEAKKLRQRRQKLHIDDDLDDEEDYEEVEEFSVIKNYTKTSKIHEESEN